MDSTKIKTQSQLPTNPYHSLLAGFPNVNCCSHNSSTGDYLLVSTPTTTPSKTSSMSPVIFLPIFSPSFLTTDLSVSQIICGLNLSLKLTQYDSSSSCEAALVDTIVQAFPVASSAVVKNLVVASGRMLQMRPTTSSARNIASIIASYDVVVISSYSSSTLSTQLTNYVSSGEFTQFADERRYLRGHFFPSFHSSYLN